MISIARILGAPVIEPQGKSAASTSTGPSPSSSVGGDGRGHLQQRRIGLDREQRRHLDAAGAGDAGEIVAQQIDDHQILGALLGIGGEGGGIGVGRRGALHRPRGEAARLEREEQFRREAEQPVGAGEDDGAMAGARALAQRRVERERMARGRDRGGEGEVGLVDVAGLDMGLHRRERGLDIRRAR